MSTITTISLRARALEAHERAEEQAEARRRCWRPASQLRHCQKTEDLVFDLFHIEVATTTGEVEIDGLRLGARWLSLAGYTGWRLCLLETCVLCRRDVATPLVAGIHTLGPLLAERERGVQPCHRPEVNCLRGGA